MAEERRKDANGSLLYRGNKEWWHDKFTRQERIDAIGELNVLLERHDMRPLDQIEYYGHSTDACAGDILELINLAREGKLD